MTYCVAMALNEGLLFASDSRTNAGVDHISTFSKMTLFEVPGERVIVLLNSGNLATTQTVINLLRKAVGTDRPNLLAASSMFDCATMVGETVRSVISQNAGQQAQVGNVAKSGLGLPHKVRAEIKSLHLRGMAGGGGKMMREGERERE